MNRALGITYIIISAASFGTLAILGRYAYADGTTECMLDVPRWDFHWQGAYVLQNKTTFNPGDKMYLECHWDNSAGTTDVNWGEGTGDEMCLTGFYVTQ